MSNYKMRCVAYHEAGHALVAVHEGFTSYGIVVRMNISGHASTSIRLPGATALGFASRRLRVLLAGAVAECLKMNPGDERCLLGCFAKNGSANDDWRKAEEIARVLAQDVTGGAAPDDEAMKAATDMVVSEHIRQVQAVLELNSPILDRLGQLAIARFKDLLEQNPADLNSISELAVTENEVREALEGLRLLKT